MCRKKDLSSLSFLCVYSVRVVMRVMEGSGAVAGETGRVG